MEVTKYNCCNLSVGIILITSYGVYEITAPYDESSQSYYAKDLFTKELEILHKSDVINGVAIEISQDDDK